MSGAIYKAASGALLQQMRLDLLSNNLANVNTAGYKADTPVFRMDALENLPEPGASSELTPYAPPLEASINFAAGPVAKTGNPLDVAIVGKGFFAVQAPEGTMYTRNGNFTINEEGVLSTPKGWPVMGQGGEIDIDGGRVEISEQGDVFVDGDLVDTLRVVDFPKPYDMRKMGATLFLPAQGGEAETLEEDVQIAQGFVESSNVDAIRTMTEMIETLRVFESYQRVIRAVDDATAKTVSEVGQVV